MRELLNKVATQTGLDDGTRLAKQQYQGGELTNSIAGRMPLPLGNPQGIKKFTDQGIPLSSEAVRKQLFDDEVLKRPPKIPSTLDPQHAMDTINKHGGFKTAKEQL